MPNGLAIGSAAGQPEAALEGVLLSGEAFGESEVWGCDGPIWGCSVRRYEEHLMEFVPLLVLSALIKKVVDLLKYAANGDWNGVCTQAVVWGSGVVLSFLTANSDFGRGFVVNGLALSALNGWSLVLVGLVLGSSAGVGWDLIKAVDNHNSAAMPDLTPARRADAPEGSRAVAL